MKLAPAPFFFYKRSLMTRSFTPKEEAQAKLAWPKMNTAGVVVTDEATPRYNCLAWTLGIATRWLWPWPPGAVSKDDFDAFYLANGFVPSPTGPIAAFGLGPGKMTHGSVSGTGHGPRWESKCGAWLRIQHGLAEMEGGAIYGHVLGFYAASSLGETAAERLTAMKTERLSKAELKFIKARAEQVADELRERFARAYARWKEDWDHPLMALSSDPAARTQTPAFLELIALGSEILPLLMERLTHADEFFALQAVDRLIRLEFVVRHDPTEPAVLLGEQGRAVETVKQWIRMEA